MNLNNLHRRHRLFAAIPFLLLLTACVDNTNAANDGDFPGDFDDAEQVYTPCQVTYESTIDSDELQWGTPGHYEEPGAYPVWNTAPSKKCVRNLTLTEGDYIGTELYITYPTASAPLRSGNASVAHDKFPVIIFAHANSWKCTNFATYISLHNHWASYGFIVVSVDESTTNCVDEPLLDNLRKRSEMQQDALKEIQRLNGDPDSIFFGKVDTERFMFSGHSRGGGASYTSAHALPNTSAVMALQALSAFTTSPYLDLPVLEVVAEGDTDLEYPKVDIMEDVFSGEYSTVVIRGGIHAFTSDGIPPRTVDEPGITEAEQHAVTNYFTAAFLHHIWGLNNDWSSEYVKDVLFSHLGSETVLAREFTPLGVVTRWRNNNERILVDTFDGKNAATNLLGGPTEFEGLQAVENATYKPETNPTRGLYGYAYALRLIAMEEEGYYKTSFDPISVPTSWTFDARVKGTDSGQVPDVLNVTLEIEQPMGGNTDDSFVTTIDMLDFSGPMELSDRFTQVHIPMEAFGFSADTIIKSVTFELEEGEFIIDDLRFTAPNAVSAFADL